MPTVSPCSQPQAITVVIYFPDEMLNALGINQTPPVCDCSCTEEGMITFFTSNFCSTFQF